MSTQLHGIADLIKRLECIAEACGEQKPKEDQPKDEFLRLKQRIYALLEQARTDIHERQSMLRKRGNCYETIQKGHSVRQALDELKHALPRLQALHKKAQGKRGAKARKEELQARYQDIRVLKRHVDELNDLFLSGQDLPDSVVGAFSKPGATLLGKAGGLRDSARANPEDARRDMTADEEDALAAMKRRDADIEKQVEEVGMAINRLDPLARQIGLTAERHRLRAEALNSDVGKAEGDLQALNKKVSEVIKYEKNTNCCCQIALMVALLCCVGFVFQQLT
eukprot:gb/GFBE01001914.1/.p1 GENE.gb/GFBE01001914.1/~~gb/GFBE01001914.1/.p1  ORF type:complete len:281 (+),score=78.56 gb/GFBE01001914.1/:1-843(+)